jgi:hypothetical protein
VVAGAISRASWARSSACRSSSSSCFTCSRRPGDRARVSSGVVPGTAEPLPGPHALPRARRGVFLQTRPRGRDRDGEPDLVPAPVEDAAATPRGRGRSGCRRSGPRGRDAADNRFRLRLGSSLAYRACIEQIGPDRLRTHRLASRIQAEDVGWGYAINLA